MHPLKILAFVIGALPLCAFLLTLFLTDGAPLKPLTHGEESRPAAATLAQPRAELERLGSVAAGGHQNADADIVEKSGIEAAFPLDGGDEPFHMVNRDRDALIFITLFGVPNPYQPPSP